MLSHLHHIMKWWSYSSTAYAAICMWSFIWRNKPKNELQEQTAYMTSQLMHRPLLQYYINMP